jgi:general secretion pathway protein E
MRACGCEACRNTGFQGRTTIVELLALTATTRAQIKHGVTDRQLEATATADGMETLLVNGLSKVARGETTLAEVLRVARS